MTGARLLAAAALAAVLFGCPVNAFETDDIIGTWEVVEGFRAIPEGGRVLFTFSGPDENLQFTHIREGLPDGPDTKTGFYLVSNDRLLLTYDDESGGAIAALEIESYTPDRVVAVDRGLDGPQTSETRFVFERR